MCSFLQCPDDLTIVFWLIGIAIVISLFILFKLNNKKLALIVPSVLLGIVFFLISISGSLIFRIYNIEWLQYFAIFIWPIINIILIVFYVRKKKQ